MYAIKRPQHSASYHHYQRPSSLASTRTSINNHFPLAVLCLFPGQYSDVVDTPFNACNMMHLPKSVQRMSLTCAILHGLSKKELYICTYVSANRPTCIRISRSLILLTAKMVLTNVYQQVQLHFPLPLLYLFPGRHRDAAATPFDACNMRPAFTASQPASVPASSLVRWSE